MATPKVVASDFAMRCTSLSRSAADTLHRLAIRGAVRAEDEAYMQTASQLPAAALWAAGLRGGDVPEPALFDLGARRVVQDLFAQAFKNVQNTNGASDSDRLLDVHRVLIAVGNRERVEKLRLADASDVLAAFHEAASSVYVL